MPARNVARTVQATFDAIPPGTVDEIVLVDNASSDDTASLAEKLGITVVRHPVDRGYGGSLKTCLATALELGADLILELHPDNQYPAELVPDLLETSKDPAIGLVMGSRFLPPRRALDGGMPLWKYVSNRALSRMNGMLLGVHLSEFHTGFRVYNARCVERIPFHENSDDFVFSFEIIAQTVQAGFRVAEIPASARYHEEASSNPLRGSIKYGLGTLGAGIRYRLGRLPGSPRRAA